MSISSKKINQMIEQEFLSSVQYSTENSKLLISLARDIYAIESSFEGGSDRQKIEDIRDKLSFRANEYIAN